MGKKLTDKQANDGNNHISSAALHSGARPSEAGDVKRSISYENLKYPNPYSKKKIGAPIRLAR